MAIGIAQAAANLNVRGLNTAATLWCSAAMGALVRALLLQGLSAGGTHLRRLDSSNIEDSDRVEVLAVLSADHRSDGVLEQIVGRLSLEPSITAARWRVEAVTEQ
jgi:putative Mg2+ transporter-C (MgtC) family protein